MKPLTINEIRGILPDFDELRPLADQILAQSNPDPERHWAGSGALGTAGSRLVDAAALEGVVQAVAAREQEHNRQIYSLIAASISGLERGDAPAAARALLDVAALEEQRDRPRRAAAYASAAYDLVRGGTAVGLSSRALRRRARARRAEGLLAEAARDYESAHAMALAARDTRGTAEAAIGLGNVLEEQGRWTDAGAWYRRALEVLDALAEPVPERWHALLNLHVVLRSLGDTEGSLAPLREAEEAARMLSDDTAAQFLENARGQLLMAQGRFQEAIDRLHTAISSSTNARSAVTIRLNLAEALFAAGRNLDAAEEARRAEREALTARLPQKLPEVYRILGRVAAAEGDPDALVLFEQALDVIRSRSLPELELALTLQTYSAAEQLVGEEETAHELRTRANEIYRRLGIDRSRSEWADQFGSDRDGDGETKGIEDNADS